MFSDICKEYGELNIASNILNLKVVKRQSRSWRGVLQP